MFSDRTESSQRPSEQDRAFRRPLGLRRRNFVVANARRRADVKVQRRRSAVGPSVIDTRWRRWGQRCLDRHRRRQCRRWRRRNQRVDKELKWRNVIWFFIRSCSKKIALLPLFASFRFKLPELRKNKPIGLTSRYLHFIVTVDPGRTEIEFEFYGFLCQVIE